MQSTTERREEIRQYLSQKREVTIQELVNHFGVSRSSIKRDLAVLCETVNYSSFSGNGGGIRVADGWYADRRYLNQAQEALLASLYPGLQPEQQKVMESILAAFAKPKI